MRLGTRSGALGPHVLLTYPDGRVHTAAERWFLRGAYATSLLWLAILTVAEPSWLIGCRPDDCPTNLVQIHPSATAVTALYRTVRPILAVALGLWLLVLIARRRGRMVPAQRRTATPVLWATVGPLGNFLYSTGLNLVGWHVAIPPTMYGTYRWGNAVVAFWVPIALVVGLYTSKLARADVATLLLRLRTASVDELRSGLVSVLRDPTLQIAVPKPRLGVAEAAGRVEEYVDPAGRPVSLPGSGDPRVITELGGGMLLLHHPSARDEDSKLFDAAIAAATVTLDNARLTAEVRIQLAEVTASRERLVHAADDERRRVERDLHDGAQQQLIGVGMALQSARLAVPEHSDAAKLLDEANDQLRDSITELRALARGLRPALLAERGLKVALDELRRRVKVPVSLSVELSGRLDAAVETAAYFVAAEALQNVTRHAPAASVEIQLRHDEGQLLVSVRDDGPGGADQRVGSGLRGLADRVAAVGGSLTVASAAGEGTTVSARMPVSSKPPDVGIAQSAMARERAG